MRPVFATGVSRGSGDEVLAAAIRDTLITATDNFAWLDHGDRVLLKPALNSGDPYPSTTHPLALSVAAGLLEERGAKVTIGDQSGIEHVLHDPGGVIRGSSREIFFRSGMGAAGESRFVSFEEDGWEAGFYHHQSENTRSWRSGFFISRWAENADHILCLPRLSTHSQAGATLGLKCMVGMLREDSRLEFHANGPYNTFILNAAKGSTLISRDDGTAKFLEKIVEISDAIRKKLRLTLFVATEAQTTFGPDRYSIRAGNGGLGKPYIASPDPGFVFGSPDPVAAEAFALALLLDLKTMVPFWPRLLERVMLHSNRNVQDLRNIAVKDHPYIRHAVKIGLGGMPGEIVYRNIPEPIQDRLNRALG
jgi:hypothetical protein